MSWMDWQEELQNILQIPVTQTVLENIHAEPGDVLVDGLNTRIMIAKEGKALVSLVIQGRVLTETEVRLVKAWWKSEGLAQEKRAAGPKEIDKQVQQMRQWLLSKLETGLLDAEVPDLIAKPYLYQNKIPFLITGEFSEQRMVPYKELKKLLETFFESEIVLIPLEDKEWLILGPEQLLEAAREEWKDNVEETTEELLASICSGLYEMLSSEWVGKCNISVHAPILPAKHLLLALHTMREAVLLGRIYRVNEPLYLPWKLRLEKLVHQVPPAMKERFIEQVFRKRPEHQVDSELAQTLELFFEMDCNISDTAKVLYIHRNTLLYRLDKFKAETGLDVRRFEDAVLVRIALLLYKVTKRG